MGPPSLTKALRPSNLRKGTKQAHIIAVAAIKELLLGSEKQELDAGKGSEMIFNIDGRGGSRLTREDREDIDSVVSFLSNNTKGTKTKIFKELLTPRSLQLMGADDEISVISDDAGDGSVSRLTFEHRTLRTAQGSVAGGDNDDNNHAFLDEASSVMKRRSFRRWRSLVRSRILARFALRALRRYSKSMNKSKTVAFRIWLLYLTHLKTFCFGGLKRWREYKRWCESVSRHVEDVRRLRIKKETLQLWSARYTSILFDVRKRKVLNVWSQNSTRRYFRKWRIYAVVTTGWMLHLALGKWRRVMRKALKGRGRIRGRRNKRIKQCVWETLAANAVRGREIKLKTRVCLETYRQRLLKASWGWFRTKCKAVAVKAMVERRKMVSFFNFLSLRMRLRSVQNEYVVSKGFKWWKRAANVRMTVRRVTEACHKWIAEKIFSEWRGWYVGEKVRDLTRI